jgi:hypothetical protein
MESLLNRLFMYKQIKRNGLLLSIALFFISLWLPCYYTPDDCYYGISAFLFGWKLIGGGTVGTGWIANPLLFVSWILYKKLPVVSLMFGLLAFGIALAVPVLTAVKSVWDEIHNYMPGYWLWLAAFLIMLISNSIYLIKKQNVS